MKRGLTEIILIWDTCFSVKNAVEDEKDGFLKFLSQQEKQNGDLRITLIAQDGSFTAENQDIRKFKLPKQLLKIGGTCSFIDTSALALTQMGRRYQSTPDKELPEHVIFVIIAADRDYSSKQYTYDQLQDLMAHQRDVYQWNCVLMTGSNLVKNKLKNGTNSIISLNTQEPGYFLNGFQKLSEVVSHIRSNEILMV